MRKETWPDDVLDLLDQMTAVLEERDHLKAALLDAWEVIAAQHEAVHTLTETLEYMEDHGRLPRWAL